MKRRLQLHLITPFGTLKGKVEEVSHSDGELSQTLRSQIQADALSMPLEDGSIIAVNKEMLGRCVYKLEFLD